MLANTTRRGFIPLSSIQKIELGYSAKKRNKIYISICWRMVVVNSNASMKQSLSITRVSFYIFLILLFLPLLPLCPLDLVNFCDPFFFSRFSDEYPLRLAKSTKYLKRKKKKYRFAPIQEFSIELKARSVEECSEGGRTRSVKMLNL